MLDLIIKNGKCYIDGELKDVDVSVKNGKIQALGKTTEEAKQLESSLTLLMSLLIRFCKKSLASEPLT